MKILMVLTSHDELGRTGRKTGLWLEESVAPYYVFKDAGAEIVIASPKGGEPPVDPKSYDQNAQSDDTRRFDVDSKTKAKFASSVTLASVSQKDFEAVFYPGGHGPLWDLAEDSMSIKLIESFLVAGKPVGFVCHAPGVLRHVKSADGMPLVDGKEVTGFTDTEEEAIGLTKIVPFLVEDELKAKGGLFSRAGAWQPHVVQDGLLVTGQNPVSSGPVAVALLEMLTSMAA